MVTPQMQNVYKAMVYLATTYPNTTWINYETILAFKQKFAIDADCLFDALQGLLRLMLIEAGEDENYRLCSLTETLARTQVV